MRAARKNILIVDSHLRLVFGLGQALDAAGYASWPAKDVVDAQSLIMEMGVTVDLLIIRHSVAGASAFAEGLRESQGQLKIIGLFAGDEGSCEGDIFMDSWRCPPVDTDDTAKLGHLVDLTRRVLGASVSPLRSFQAAATNHP
jgi:hypothetical protein